MLQCLDREYIIVRPFEVNMGHILENLHPTLHIVVGASPGDQSLALYPVAHI